MLKEVSYLSRFFHVDLPAIVAENEALKKELDELKNKEKVIEPQPTASGWFNFPAPHIAALGVFNDLISSVDDFIERKNNLFMDSDY